MKQTFTASIKLVLMSVCGGVLFYTMWLAAFLSLNRFLPPDLHVVFFALGTITTAVGFTAGIVLAEHVLNRHVRSRLFHLLIWIQVGCTFGAGIVYPLGPMLIVFGMLAFGTLNASLWEFLGLSKIWHIVEEEEEDQSN